MPTFNEHAMVSILGCHTSAQSSSSLPCQKLISYKVRAVFHALRVRDGPPSPNHDPFVAKLSSYHVHVTLRVTLPTSPYPPFLLMQNLHSAQCDEKVHYREEICI